MFLISRKDDPSQSERVDAAELMAACARLAGPERHALNVVDESAVVAAPPANSTFGGPLVSDAAAKVRIEAQHAALGDNGVKVDIRQQFFATGTRMADVGYRTQEARAIEHAAKMPARVAADALSAIVRDERREDLIVTAGQFAGGLHANGRITFDGLAIGEQAIRGLATRLDSPMLGYVLGLRDRVTANVRAAKAARDEGKPADAFVEAARKDRAEIATVLAHECRQAPDVQLKLRARRAVGDIFAVLSPGYGSADAPEIMAELASVLPSDAKGTWSYDAASTTWVFHAHVWTPTPVAQQAVGEAFEGYAKFYSRDNGTSRFNGGGGATLLRCLNASTYTAGSSDVSRVHRAGVRRDIARMLRGALKAIDALCKAWGTNRETAIDVPSGVTLEQAIPGFWRYCLRDQRSDLAGVLPGRSEEHVKGLTAAFHAERRDADRLVRSDLAQGWTRYVQGQPAPVRREAEAAIGDWLVNAKPIACDIRGGK